MPKMRAISPCTINGWLRGRPQVDTVRAVAGHRGVGLHAVVIDHGERVAALEDAVRGGQTLVDVPLLHPLMGAHVAGRLVVDQRCTRSQGRVHAKGRRQLLVVHVDEGEGRLRGVLVLRGHGRHRLAHVAHLVHGYHRPAVVERVDTRQVLRGDHRTHAPERLRPRGVDGPDARVRQWASQDPPFEHPGEHDVAGIPGSPRHLVDAVHPWNVPAHVLEIGLRHGLY